nr:AlNc14C263G9839 [Albugo laibachii Nc14]CCA24945.1 AlNc14C266G9890 [Albugo laibachii Nc14]|eukprot:CCA24945.1 AlNc14C266G9890 [Albugo laibachii Nc14]
MKFLIRIRSDSEDHRKHEKNRSVTSQKNQHNKLQFSLQIRYIQLEKHPNQNVSGTKSVFAIKQNENGNIERFEARVVALGSRQTYGVDFCFLRYLLSCLEHELSSRLPGSALPLRNDNSQYDAFINGVLEDVYINTPQAVDMIQNQVLKLDRSLYSSKNKLL